MVEAEDIFRRKYGRERQAREEAEHLLEAKSRELYRSRGQLDAAYRENMKFLSVLSGFASAITSITSEHDLVWYTAREVVGRLGFVDCVIYLYDEAKGCIVQRAAIAEKNTNDDEIINALEIPLGKGITGSVAASKKAEIVADVSKDPRYIADVGTNASEICVPMIHNDRLIGVIDSESPELNKFTSSDLDILKTVAAYAAAKIAQIQARQEAEQRTKDLEKRVKELTELKEELVAAKEKAEETSALKSRFVATISHEIRTPLSGILGSLDLLQDEALPEEARKLVSMAWTSGQTLQTLLNDVIDFARTEAGTLHLEPTVFSISDLITSIRSFWQPHVAARGSSLDVDIQEGVGAHYWGDPARIRQIMNNYISNAIKYAPSNRYVIKVQARNEGALRWSVCDFGPGLKQSDSEQLFTQFTRVGANKRKIGEGAGLGLAICKQLATLMEGRVGVTSAPGIGAAFWFEAPFDEVHVCDVSAKEPKKDRRNFKDRFGRMPRILVAEDVPTNQMLIRMSLEAFGCRVTIVNNGVEAVEAATNHSYDLIFMDIAMPEMDGTAATARILQVLGPENAPPIYALTAHGMDEDREEFAAAGMCGIVTKPFNREDLYTVVERAVTAHEPQVGEKEEMSENAEFGEIVAFDAAVLDELMASLDRDSCAMLLGQCMADLRSNLDTLTASLETGAVQQAAEAAHRIKSVSGTFGLTRVQHMANEANNSWQEGDADSCGQYCRLIAAELPEGIDILQDYALKHGDRT
ncbi:MAG: response regulator [Alphaproteobacteria bacterium]|nr:response regulator [Alphaproteobacteria bacterium]